ncbi:MAG: hypothetical protein QM811_04825 [Pirellulales bacterium]
MEELELSDIYAPLRPETASGLRNLRSLTVGYRRATKRFERDTFLSDFVHALPTLPRLTKFDAFDLYLGLPGQDFALLMDKAPNLTELNAAVCALDETALTAVRRPNRLTTVRMNVCESRIEAYCDFLEAVAANWSAESLEITDHEGYSPYDPLAPGEIETSGYREVENFRNALLATDRSITMRNRAFRHATWGCFPRVIVEGCDELEGISFELCHSTVVRGCPKLESLWSSSETFFVEDCPTLKSVYGGRSRTVTLKNLPKLQSVRVIACDELILAEKQGFEILVFGGNVPAGDRGACRLPVIPGLRRVLLYGLSKEIVANLKKQTGPLEVSIVIRKSAGAMLEPDSVSRLLTEVPIRSLLLLSTDTETDPEIHARTTFAALERSAMLEELNLYGLSSFFPEHKRSADETTTTDDESLTKLWSLTLPPSLKKLIVSSGDYRKSLDPQDPRVVWLKKRYPQIQIDVQ